MSGGGMSGPGVRIFCRLDSFLLRTPVLLVPVPGPQDTLLDPDPNPDPEPPVDPLPVRYPTSSARPFPRVDTTCRADLLVSLSPRPKSESFT